MIDTECRFYRPFMREDDVGLFQDGHKCLLYKLCKRDLECDGCKKRKPKAPYKNNKHVRRQKSQKNQVIL